MDRSRRTVLGLVGAVLTAGCAQVVGGDPLEVTPAPVPTDEADVEAAPRPVVEFVNQRAHKYGVTVTVVDAELDRLEITWVNDITSSIAVDDSAESPIHQLTTRGAIRHVDPPSDVSVSRRSGEVDGHGRLELAGPGTDRATGVIVEVRPTDGSGSYVGFAEPLLAAVLVTCDAGERVDSLRLTISETVTIDAPTACTASE